jgi:hypothetical protein
MTATVSLKGANPQSAFLESAVAMFLPIIRKLGGFKMMRQTEIPDSMMVAMEVADPKLVLLFCQT